MTFIVLVSINSICVAARHLRRCHWRPRPGHLLLPRRLLHLSERQRTLQSSKWTRRCRRSSTPLSRRRKTRSSTASVPLLTVPQLVTSTFNFSFHLMLFIRINLFQKIHFSLLFYLHKNYDLPVFAYMCLHFHLFIACS